ncbi:penicillin acylase family protein [Sphingomonas xanthus]|uniref:Acylase n=1 Tax=Sphingomonas xanthus TaxID=2594473 RepID=A0A516IQM3_9SPHN|nr:penicillin acylase family protein [Sphingomonas xanthus]QDP19213.1 acylase [Sphingomonas xanthus]
MRPLILPLALILIAASPAEEGQWREQAQRVTIVRDDHGIAHIQGRTDADAVFGMIYAQAEDDFPRIEANYLTALGRMAEAEGEKAIWQDLRARLYVSENELVAEYRRSPAWLRLLMDSWAAGLNHYLATHPEVKPRVLTRFEPWMALSFTEGSIGGDIERIDLKALERFYSETAKQAAAPHDPEPRGSNGIAIAPALTRDGKALLLINPHTSFYFRAEQQVTSEEGLNAYGASTWGQFFIYQGFNDRAGWMHTSSGVDNVDEFAETVSKGHYRDGDQWRALGVRPVTIRYRAADGTMAERRFDSWRTHHGPIVRSEGGKWISFAMMHRPLEALQQSYLRTKARDLPTFLRIADFKGNSSNNTLYADADGRIAYLHPQFVPVRDPRFDYTRPVDGSDPRTDWRALHEIADLPNVIDPATGWAMNTNNWPYSAAGKASPKPADYPRYMDVFGENYRGVHATALLKDSRGWTLERLRDAAYDSHQPAFARLIPGLVTAWDRAPAGPDKDALAEPIARLRDWDHRWATDSVAQSLAMFWASPLWDKVRVGQRLTHMETIERIERLPDREQLEALSAAMSSIRTDFGDWRTPWGQINRFQRISGAIDHPFDDRAQSIPVGFASGNFGSLASFGSAPRGGSTNWYGTSGNSFVAFVEFGPRVRAHALSVGGQSGHPASPHFNDQAVLYATGRPRKVHFYPDELRGHIRRTYRPGE